MLTVRSDFRGARILLLLLLALPLLFPLLSPLAVWVRISIAETAEEAIRRIQAGRYTPMPPPTTAPASGPAGKGMTIENGTGQTLHVHFSGPVSRTVVVPDGGSESIELAVGDYQVAAEVPGSRIIPFFGRQAYQPFTHYWLKFYTQRLGPAGQPPLRSQPAPERATPAAPAPRTGASRQPIEFAGLVYVHITQNVPQPVLYVGDTRYILQTTADSALPPEMRAGNTVIWTSGVSYYVKGHLSGKTTEMWNPDSQRAEQRPVFNVVELRRHVASPLPPGQEVARLTSSDVDNLVRQRGFNHPDKAVSGSVRHDYHRQILGGREVVVDRMTRLMWLPPAPVMFMLWDLAAEFTRNLNRNRIVRVSPVFDGVLVAHFDGK